MIFAMLLPALFLLVNVFTIQVKGHQVCYGDYGCFSDEPPFNRDYAPLPISPESMLTSFRLFNRNIPSENGKILTALNLESLRASSFKEENKTVFIIHGFIENGLKPWIKELVSALLVKNDIANVISVDWSIGASAIMTYPQAVANTRVVGAQVAELITWLCDKTNVTAASFHIIGASLGAHVAGYAGRRLREKGMMLRRITGLDPAGPGFNDVDPVLRLDASDASFVDVIHTDIDGAAIGGFGIAQPSGHVDFYPNGGDDQPMCNNGFAASVKELVKGNFNRVLGCSHNRAIYLFLHSIKDLCELRGYPCESWQEFKDGRCSECNGRCVEMGYNSEKYSDTQGTFYLQTSGREPFCVLEYEVTIHSLVTERRFGFSSFYKSKIKIQLLGEERNSPVVTITRSRFGKDSLILRTSPIGQLKAVRVWYRGFVSAHFNKVLVEATHDKYQSFCARLDVSMKPSFSYKSTVSPLVGGLQC